AGSRLAGGELTVERDLHPERPPPSPPALAGARRPPGIEPCRATPPEPGPAPAAVLPPPRPPPARAPRPAAPEAPPPAVTRPPRRAAPALVREPAGGPARGEAHGHPERERAAAQAGTRHRSGVGLPRRAGERDPQLEMVHPRFRAVPAARKMACQRGALRQAQLPVQLEVDLPYPLVVHQGSSSRIR